MIRNRKQVRVQVSNGIRQQQIISVFLSLSLRIYTIVVVVVVHRQVILSLYFLHSLPQRSQRHTGLLQFRRVDLEQRQSHVLVVGFQQQHSSRVLCSEGCADGCCSHVIVVVVKGVVGVDDDVVVVCLVDGVGDRGGSWRNRERSVNTNDVIAVVVGVNVLGIHRREKRLVALFQFSIVLMRSMQSTLQVEQHHTQVVMPTPTHTHPSPYTKTTNC